MGNVWEFATGRLCREQMKGEPEPHRSEDRMVSPSLHPCQKPLAFASRAILASTRIGDTILDPFAGTNRIAVACTPTR
jgi:DNA modification methylase